MREILMENTELTEIKLDIREIKTLLMERDKIVERHSVDIDKAFKTIRALQDAMTNEIANQRHLEQKLESVQTSLNDMNSHIQSLEKEMNKRFQKLDGTHRVMLWIIGLAGTVIGGALNKFFLN
jgi:chromosome segregation ATPase